jgi:hypothetical protein
LAIIDLITPTSACIGVRCIVVCPPLPAARPIAASISGRLVTAARRAPGFPACTYQLHHL